jgi:uncharacterized protein
MPTDAPPTAVTFTGHFPGRAPIDAYGNGGFRFAGMSHRGSILCLPDGVYAWDIASAGELTLATLARALGALERPQFLLLGTGRTQVFPTLDVRRAFEAKLVGLEVMDTGAAARTFNVLLAEQRPVSAALLAVD